MGRSERERTDRYYALILWRILEAWPFGARRDDLIHDTAAFYGRPCPPQRLGGAIKALRYRGLVATGTYRGYYATNVAGQAYATLRRGGQI